MHYCSRKTSDQNRTTIFFLSSQETLQSAKTVPAEALLILRGSQIAGFTLYIHKWQGG